MITYEEALALVKQAEPIGLLQSHIEAAQFAEFVANTIKPVHILEIGTCSGGNLYLMHLAALADGAREGLRLSIDMPWSSRDPNVYGHEQRFKNVLQQVVEIIGNSHSPDTLRRVKEVLEFQAMAPSGDHLEAAKFDLIYQDSDHTAEGSFQDFLDYSPLLRPGGYWAQHDCRNNHPCNATAYRLDKMFPEHWIWTEESNLFGVGCWRIP